MPCQRPHLVIIGNTHSSPSAEAFLVKFATIAKDIARRAYFMTADPPPTFPNVEWIPAKAGQSNNLPTRYVLFAMCQLGICLRLVRMRRKYQKSIVLTAPDILPVVLLKALGKQVFTYVDGKPVALFLQMCCRLSFVFSTILLAETWSLLDFWGIRNRTKARRGALYADTAYFVMTRKLADRDCKVGFFGTLEIGKGIREMLGAIRLLKRTEEKIGYLIGGSGNLGEEVRRFSTDYHDVDFRGQIPWSSIPAALNECKLIVVPSQSEGLPNIVLEAMACGTPVLATSVGGIPDIITDGKNGFLLPRITPECIADNILRALHSPDLRRVAENASEEIKADFTLERALARYKRIFWASRNTAG